MYLLFDIGGTNIRVASADNSGIKDVVAFKSLPGFKENVRALKTAVAKLKLDSVKAAVAGIPRFRHGQLTIWLRHNTAKELSKIAKCKVLVENDAILAGIAEAGMGAGKNMRIVGYLTFSTGLGGAKIVSGRPDENSIGFEPRLQLFSYKGKILPADFFTSGRGIKKFYGKNPEEITSADTWKQIEHWMGLLVNNAAVLWSPDVLVLAGPIAMNKHISISRIQKLVSKNFVGMPKVPQIKKAQLGQLAGLYGCLIVAKSAG